MAKALGNMNMQFYEHIRPGILIMDYTDSVGIVVSLEKSSATIYWPKENYYGYSDILDVDDWHTHFRHWRGENIL